MKGSCEQATEAEAWSLAETVGRGLPGVCVCAAEPADPPAPRVQLPLWARGCSPWEWFCLGSISQNGPVGSGDNDHGPVGPAICIGYKELESHRGAVCRRKQPCAKRERDQLLCIPGLGPPVPRPIQEALRCFQEESHRCQTSRRGFMLLDAKCPETAWFWMDSVRRQSQILCRRAAN